MAIAASAVIQAMLAYSSQNPRRRSRAIRLAVAVTSPARKPGSVPGRGQQLLGGGQQLGQAGWAREYTDARPATRMVIRPQSRRQARCLDTVDCARPSWLVRSVTRVSQAASAAAGARQGRRCGARWP